MDNVALNSSEPTCDFRVVETQFSSFRGSQFFREHLGQRLPLEIHVRLGIAHRSIDIRIPVNPKTLGDRLLLKRIAADLSQPEVAKRAGVSVRTVRKWEYGIACPTEGHWQALERFQ